MFMLALYSIVNPVIGPARNTRPYGAWKQFCAIVTLILFIAMLGMALSSLLPAVSPTGEPTPIFWKSNVSSSLRMRFFKMRSTVMTPSAPRDRSDEDSLFFKAQLLEKNVVMDLTVVIDTGGCMSLLPAQLERKLPQYDREDIQHGEVRRPSTASK